MSEKNFGRRRRGLRFRPSGGLGQGPHKPDREATQARAESTSQPAARERLFERRHVGEIERAENIAAGLPPEGAPAEPTPGRDDEKRKFREPNLQTPAEVQEEKPYEPVTMQEQPKGIVESIKFAATNLVKRVQRL
ncbi:MAG TPA: ribonuclease E/G, partial [Verrucomicrobiae bacterium]|nr:ribonuclease E/G [Verrucomicrobiae bacterium]